MSIATVYSGCVAKAHAVAGIVAGPTLLPGQADTLNLPMTLVTIGPGRATPQTRGDRIHWYDVSVHFLIAPVGQGIGIDEPAAKCRTVVQAAVAAFTAAPWITDQTESIEGDIEHGGIRSDIPYGKGTYWGFTLTFTVKEIS